MDQVDFDKMAEDNDVTWRTIASVWKLSLIVNVIFGGGASLTYWLNSAQSAQAWIVFLFALFVLGILAAKNFWLAPAKMAVWAIIFAAPTLLALLGLSAMLGVTPIEIGMRAILGIVVVLATVFVRRALWRAGAEELLEKSDNDGEAA